MDLSVIIPTHGRPDRLAACVRALADQNAAAGHYEVLIGLDGDDPASRQAAERAWHQRSGRCGRLTVLDCPRAGLNSTRNRLLEAASGRIVLSLNDDVLPAAGCLGAHVEAHAEAGDHFPRGAIVSGYSPFVDRTEPTLFDVLCAETSMIFFYDQMIEARATRDPWHDWGFRHCWGLNFSAPLELVHRVGGFTAFPMLYGYDDIEIAWRMREAVGTLPVLFRRTAYAPHDHRYTADDVLAREMRLGHTAWHFAGRNAAFAEEVFGRDIRSEDEIAYSREFVERERSGAERAQRTFSELEAVPASSIEHNSDRRRKCLVDALYQQHLLLKRWQWRRGLLAGSEGLSAAMLEAKPRVQAAVPAR